MVREQTPQPARTVSGCSQRVFACRPPLLGQLAGLFRETNAFAAPDDDGAGGTGATEIDLEEQAAGYQAAYSKLAAAGAPARDVVAYAGDVRLHVAREFTRLLSAEPGVRTLVEQADQSQVGPFLLSLGVSV
jgi:exportin-2 (importin alpha re-exporter)